MGKSQLIQCGLWTQTKPGLCGGNRSPSDLYRVMWSVFAHHRIKGLGAKHLKKFLCGKSVQA